MPHQEWDESERCPIGRDPRKMAREELEALGHHKRPLLKVIRQNCIQCSGGHEAAEVRRCGNHHCPFWPYRMASNPFAAEQSDERRQAASERMKARNGKRKEFA